MKFFLRATQKKSFLFRISTVFAHFLNNTFKSFKRKRYVYVFNFDLIRHGVDGRKIRIQLARGKIHIQSEVYMSTVLLKDFKFTFLLENQEQLFLWQDDARRTALPFITNHQKNHDTYTDRNWFSFLHHHTRNHNISFTLSLADSCVRRQFIKKKIEIKIERN